MTMPASAHRSAGPSGAAASLVVLLGLLALVYFAWPLWRAQFLLEIDQNEAWDAHWAMTAHAGIPIYQDIGTLVANNYPPLSFLVVGWLTGFGFDPVITGRVLSLAATLVAAGAIARLVSLLGGGGIAAAVGALWFVATAARFYDGYVGMADPNLVALALMLWGLAFAVAAGKRGRTAAPAFVLMAAAGFVKHTLLATPLAAFLWLLMVDRRLAIRGALAGAVVAAAGLALCILWFGHPFVAQLTAPRVTTIGRMLASLGLLQWLAPGMAIALAYGWLDRRRLEARLVLIYIAAAFTTNLLMQAGQGIALNAQFELLAASAIGTGLAFDRLATVLPRSRPLAATRVVILAILIARLLLSLRGEPYLLLASPQFRDTVRQADAVAEAEAARIAAMPGNVACLIPLVCYRAGKPYVYDIFSMNQQVLNGQMTAEALQAKLAEQAISVAPVDARASMEHVRKAGSIENALR